MDKSDETDIMGFDENHLNKDSEMHLFPDEPIDVSTRMKIVDKFVTGRNEQKEHKKQMSISINEDN